MKKDLYGNDSRWKTWKGKLEGCRKQLKEIKKIRKSAKQKN
jgi:hypothetical protein